MASIHLPSVAGFLTCIDRSRGGIEPIGGNVSPGRYSSKAKRASRLGSFVMLVGSLTHTYGSLRMDNAGGRAEKQSSVMSREAQEKCVRELGRYLMSLFVSAEVPVKSSWMSVGGRD